MPYEITYKGEEAIKDEAALADTLDYLGEEKYQKLSQTLALLDEATSLLSPEQTLTEVNRTYFTLEMFVGIAGYPVMALLRKFAPATFKIAQDHAKTLPQYSKSEMG